MTQAAQLKPYLLAGHFYRRSDLAEWSNAADRYLRELQADGTLKVAYGLYYCPRISAFGKTPPDDKELIRAFLKDDCFLLISPNDYNKLGLGTTQLYNKLIVYNRKRHGKLKLANRNFTFRRKSHFPEKVTTEFLLVDLVNNLDSLAENANTIMARLKHKVAEVNKENLISVLERYGNIKTRKILNPLLHVQSGFQDWQGHHKPDRI